MGRVFALSLCLLFTVLLGCAVEPGQLSDRAERAAEEEGDLEMALQLITQAIGENPADGVNHRRQGDWLRDLGRLPEALEAYDRAAESPDPSPSAHRKSTEVALEIGDLEGAESRLTRAREALTSDSDLATLDQLEQRLLSMKAEVQDNLDQSPAPEQESL